MTKKPLDIPANRAKWTVPFWAIGGVVAQMLDVLPRDPYDPNFVSQYHQTTYFDTPSRSLLKARLPKKDYVTLRLRAYGPGTSAGGQYPVSFCSLSAKTPKDKESVPVSPATAAALLKAADVALLGQLLPPECFAKLLTLIAGEPLMPVVTVCCSRYAVEEGDTRLTLDCGIRTDNGKHLHVAILEWKCAGDQALPGSLPTPGLRPVKFSKFLWACGG